MSVVNRKRSTSIGMALLCTATVMTTGAIAGTTTDSINVSYVTADVSTSEGAQALYEHIQRAAKLVCHEPNIRELTEYRVYQKCFDRAVDAAVAKVDSSALTALHRNKTQRGNKFG
jgi:UrcA family protein